MLEIDRYFSGEVKFIHGSINIVNLPEENLPEYAFIGKSNVGKSSLINALTNRVGLAKVSNTPGRTRQINFFKVKEDLLLVDLPGYGYAKVSHSEHKNWEKLILFYISKRISLKLCFVLVDSRHGIKDNDLKVINLLEQFSRDYWIIFTKSDKISLLQQQKLFSDVKSAEYSFKNLKKIIFSNRSSDGIKALKTSFWKIISQEK